MNYKIKNKYALIFDEKYGTIITPVYKDGQEYIVYIHRNGKRHPVVYDGEFI